MDTGKHITSLLLQYVNPTQKRFYNIEPFTNNDFEFNKTFLFKKNDKLERLSVTS